MSAIPSSTDEVLVRDVRPVRLDPQEAAADARAEAAALLARAGI